jgi:nitronate monooxygenase
MFGVTTPEMVAAASKAGCLGSLSLGDLPADKCIEVISATKHLTDQSFAVNVFVNDIPEKTETLKEKYIKTKQFMEDLAAQYQLTTPLPSFDELQFTDYHEQVDAIIAEGCKILSFTFGIPDEASVQKLKSNGVTIIGTCTSVKEAVILEQSGVDMICVQGIEAGGHRGSFASDEIPQIGGLSLLAQVYEAVKLPLIYAGGIYNASTLLAAQTLGAQLFQVGSLLIGSAESALHEFEKDRLRGINESDIVLTKSFSGRYARGIRNTFIKAVEHTEYILPYPYQNKLTTELRKTAKANKNSDFVSIWAGQSINKYSRRSTTEILKELIESCF